MRFRSPVRRRLATLLPRSRASRKSSARRFGLRAPGRAYNPARSAIHRRQSAMTPTPRPSLTYAEAGVDIDAGNAMVERSSRWSARRAGPAPTRKSAASAACSISRPPGFVDPVLVAANDGVGTKVKIAIESGIHDTIGVDLVAMCVNDIVVQGAEPLFFLDYFATGRLDPAIGAEVVKGIAAGVRRGGLRADRRRDGGNAGPLRRARLRSRGLCGRRRRARPPAAERRHRKRATSCSACRRRACIPTASRWCGGSSPTAAWPVTRRRRSRRAYARGGAADADPASM